MIKTAHIFALIVFLASFSGPASAISVNGLEIKDYKLSPKNGRTIRYSDISIAVRKKFKGSRPHISKRRNSINVDCYDVKFLYKTKLKRISFNCTNSGAKLN